MLWLLVRVNYHTVKVVKVNEHELNTNKYTLYIYVATSITGLQALYTSACPVFKGKKLHQGGRAVPGDPTQELWEESALRDGVVSGLPDSEEAQTGKRGFCELCHPC